MLIPHRFCEAATPDMLERETKNLAPLSYILRTLHERFTASYYQGQSMH